MLALSRQPVALGVVTAFVQAPFAGARHKRRSPWVRVLLMYPRCSRALLEQTTRNADFQGFRVSHLTDSNRRPLLTIQKRGSAAALRIPARLHGTPLGARG
jgi:hypothetical protein